MVILKELLQKVDAGVLFIDSEHRIQWMNRKAREWFGSVRIGERRACYRTISFGQGFCTICPTGRAIECGTPTHYEFTLPGKDPRNLEVLAIPVSHNGAVRVMELIMDVTKKGIVRIKENELMAQIEKMAAIGQLAAGVAHELNTPLGTISIISEELNRAMDKLNDKEIPKKVFKEYISDMQGEITRCKTIIEDLLGFSKRVIHHFVQTDINILVSKTIEFIEKGNISKKVTIEKSLTPSLPLVTTDPDRFRQVVLNVIKNAVEAVEKGGRVEVSTRMDACYVCVHIKDNGPGIPQEHLKRVFEPFFTTKPVGKGTGLGLSVSYGIMRDLKGEIRLQSRVGRGTEVTLLLPKDIFN